MRHDFARQLRRNQTDAERKLSGNYFVTAASQASNFAVSNQSGRTSLTSCALKQSSSSSLTEVSMASKQAWPPMRYARLFFGVTAFG